MVEVVVAAVNAAVVVAVVVAVVAAVVVMWRGLIGVKRCWKTLGGWRNIEDCWVTFAAAVPRRDSNDSHCCSSNFPLWPDGSRGKWGWMAPSVQNLALNGHRVQTPRATIPHVHGRACGR